MLYDDRVTWRQRTRPAIYAVLLLWLNLYICRELFFLPTTPMNSMHGFWAALADRAGASWWSPTWWPYWDNGIPFEFTYSPLVPALTALVSALRGVSSLLAFQTVSGMVYCLVPLTLFFAAWRLTRAAGYAFAAALLYSLTSPSQILAPDVAFRWTGIWDSRRLFLLSFWDETPHLAALACLPLIILFLVRSIETGHRRDSAAAALFIGIATFASAFAPLMVAMTAICLFFALPVKDRKRSALRIIGIDLVGYAIGAAFLPPSLIRAIHESSSNWRSPPVWNAGSFTALALVVFGFTLLAVYLPRWTGDWKLRFIALFTWLAGSIPLIDTLLHRHFLPQPGRYKFELELGLAVLLVFSLRSWFEKIPPPIQRAAMFLLLALVSEQVVQYRADAKRYLVRGNVDQTIEARASRWAERNLPGVRVMFPGSIAQWATLFSQVPQLSGSSFSVASNSVQQLGVQAVQTAGDTAPRAAEISLAWLKAYGVGAVAVPAANSEEYWKGFVFPERFEGILPVLWREGGITIYSVPRRSPSLAHVLPETELVRNPPAYPDDIASLTVYDAALDNEPLPPAQTEWEGRNRLRVHAAASPGQIVSLQVSYHPGWRAFVNGRKTPILADGLGLMWLRPGCNGPCEIQLAYSGGFELRFARWLSAAALLCCLALLCWPTTEKP
jgi:hypothetical protein